VRYVIQPSFDFDTLWRRAVSAGWAAGSSQAAGEGLQAGEAWLSVRPSNSPFAKWLRSEGHGETGIEKGAVSVPIDEHSQHVAKLAHARAMASVLSKAGVDATVGERLD